MANPNAQPPKRGQRRRKNRAPHRGLDLEYGLSAEAIARRIHPKAKRTGADWRVPCPAHGGKDFNLAVGDGDKGAPVFKCHSHACPFEAIRDALAARGIGVGPQPDTRDHDHHIDRSGSYHDLVKRGWTHVATYPFQDELKQLLYEKLRLEIRNGSVGKEFRQRRRNEKGAWVYSLGDVRRVPYRLPELLSSAPQDVHICEGEKDANRLALVGLVSTSIDTLDLTDLAVFRDRVIYIHEDNDVKGRARSAELAAALLGIAAEIRIVRYLELPEKGDVSDWLDSGHDVEALLTRCDEALVWTPAAGPAAADQPVEDFDRTADGAIAKSEGNIRRALAKAGIKLSYDQFARQRIIAGLPGYGPDLTDAAIDAMWITFEREHRVRFSREHFNAVIRVEAHANSYHPVRDYLVSCTWDGNERLNRWLVTYAGAADTEINRQFGRLVMIAAVRRIRHPGTKFDAMLVLEGPEGRNKSTLFETLASQAWFSDDAPLNAEARETIERLRGKWIIEAADLSAVKRTDVERLKAFLSRSKDTATLKFERETTTALRECIFVATTNSSEYLASKTGNRRFWPLKTGTIDIPALSRDRDQLWAEAAHHEAQGVSIMLPEQLWSIAAGEQEKRRESDVWEGAIGAWLDARRSDATPMVSPAEVAREVLHLQLKELDNASQRRVYEAMRLAGWSKDAGKIIRGNRLWGPDTRVQGAGGAHSPP